MKICPSIASGDVLNIEKECKKIEKKYGHIHIDIEDGNYINNITFGMKTVKGIFKLVDCEISVHLMVSNPLPYVEDLIEIGPDIVFFHLDSFRYPSMIIDKLENAGITAGLAFNPSASLDGMEYLESRIQDILVMSCEPDLYNQRYISDIENRISRLVRRNKRIWVDGAITFEKCKELDTLGVYAAVMGRGVFEDFSNKQE